MLRDRKFQALEAKILRVIAALCFGVGLMGLVISFYRANWVLALVSAGALFLALLYFAAGRRGRPL
jgi:hypothetical protein